MIIPKGIKQSKTTDKSTRSVRFLCSTTISGLRLTVALDDHLATVGYGSITEPSDNIGIVVNSRFELCPDQNPTTGVALEILGRGIDGSSGIKLPLHSYVVVAPLPSEYWQQSTTTTPLTRVTLTVNSNKIMPIAAKKHPAQRKKQPDNADNPIPPCELSVRYGSGIVCRILHILNQYLIYN